MPRTDTAHTHNYSCIYHPNSLDPSSRVLVNAGVSVGEKTSGTNATLNQNGHPHQRRKPDRVKPAHTARRRPSNPGGIIASCSVVRGGGRRHIEVPSAGSGGVRRSHWILGVGGRRGVQLGSENHRSFSGRGILLARVASCGKRDQPE